MKVHRLSCVGLILITVITSSPSNAGPVSTSDLWQSRSAGGNFGSRVTSFSGVKLISNSSEIDNMFGDSGGVEGGNTIFKDFYYPGGVQTLVPDGYVHWVEWSTDTPVDLYSFNLHAAHNRPWDPSPARSFSRFTLYSGDGAGNWTEIYDIFTNSLFETIGTIGYLDLEVDLAAPIVAQYFRAEFVGIRPTKTTIGNSGPRIQELDGFNTYQYGSTLAPVPTPSAIWLFAMSFATLIGIGRKKRQPSAPQGQAGPGTQMN